LKCSANPVHRALNDLFGQIRLAGKSEITVISGDGLFMQAI